MTLKIRTMKKTICSLCCVVLLFLSTVLSAQKATEIQSGPEVVKKSYSKHGIGAVLSSTNGKGLAYRYWPGTYGIQVSFIPISVESFEYYNLGFTGYARLKDYNFGELFFHAEIEFQYQSMEEMDFLMSTSTYNYYRVNSNGINAGFGPDYHFEMKPASFDVFIGYGLYARDEFSDKPNADLNDGVSTFLSGGVAVFLNL